MALIPNIDFTILQTSTLTPLYYNGSYFLYEFGPHCVGSNTTINFSLCNLTSNTIEFDNVAGIGSGYIFPFLTLPITIGPYATYNFDISFNPSANTTYIGEQIFYSGSDFITIALSGVGENSLIQFTNNPCFIDYGTVGIDSYITVSKEFINTTNNNITISFSGNSQHYIVNTPITLVPGSNLINFTFNPQVLGDCNETIILQGDCNDHILNLCGHSVVGGSIQLNMDNVSSYVGCCSHPILTIYNNRVGNPNNSITATNINYPTELVTDQILPLEINGGSCATVEFNFCPTISGNTSGNINVEYIYEYEGLILTGYSEIDIILSAFTHPFSTIDINCIPFRCANVNTESIINITNPGNKPFQFYYFFVPDNQYDFYNIFETTPNPPYVIPPYSTTGITINFNVSNLTTASTFNDTFYLKIIDPDCCKEFTKCINVNFCPTTVTPNFGYPIHVTCHGECNGQYAFTVNDCSGEYHIVWSSDTRMPMVSEIQTCRIVAENNSGCITIETNELPQYYDQTSASNLYAGNYLLTITNACNEITYHSFTITQPDPLFVSISWVNPSNYCKSDISGLCGIVPSPDINPEGYVVIDKETLVKVINNDFHDIPGQTKRGLQQYEISENSIAYGQKVDAINSFRNYILDFISGAFASYKHKWKKEEKITVKDWDEIVAEIIGHGCCFTSYVSGGTPPYTYQWFGPSGYTSNSPNIFERPCCEPYTLVVTDANGCTASATSTCLQCTFGIETLTTTNPTCTYSTDGEIFIAVSGNCPDAVYEIKLESANWVETHTASTYNFINLDKGNYILHIRNVETECKLNPTYITLQPKYEFYIGANITGTTCSNYCNGVVEIWTNVVHNEDNIDPIFLYTLDGHGNYQNSNIFTGVCAGQHTIYVMNTINYCEMSETIFVPNLDLFTVETNVIPASGPKISDGKIIIKVNNGVSVCDDKICYFFEEITNLINPHYSGITQFNNNQLIISNVSPGKYRFKITDKNNCSKIFNVIVNYKKNKKPKDQLFDSKRIDSYSGFKIISNTPKGK